MIEREISILCESWLDGSITPEQCKLLLEAMEKSPELIGELQEHLYLWDLLDQTFSQDRSHFVGICLAREALEQQSDQFVKDTQERLKEWGAVEASWTDAPEFDPFDAPELTPSSDRSKKTPEQIKQIAEDRLRAFLREQAKQTISQESQPARTSMIAVRWQDVRALGGRVYRVTQVLGKVAVVFLVIFLSVLVGSAMMENRYVGQVTETKHAVWGAGRPMGSSLKRGTFVLEQGMAEVHLKQGAELVLQAPTTITLLSKNKVALSTGALSAYVPTEAHGFCVQTPGVELIDLGTEFGILAGAQETAEVHIFDGEVELASQKGGGKPITLTEDKAAIVDITGQIQQTTRLDRPRMFLRDLDVDESLGIAGKQLSLADMIGGGNGLGTGTLGQSIDPSTGEALTGSSQDLHLAQGVIRAQALMVVDSVFVADGGSTPQAISTTGLVFPQCPDTSGQSQGGVEYSAVSEPQTTHLNGLDYASQNLPSIGLAANVGITFDLDQLRKTFPHIDITGFHAVCCLPESQTNGLNSPWLEWINAWVLVDGEIRSSQALTIGQDHYESIDIPLQPKDRFLTLISTTGGEVSGKQCLFAAPILSLASRRSIASEF